MRWLLATILTLLGSHVTMAQHIVSDSIYIPPTMLPKATVFLPAPPDSVSPEFVDDLLQYQWGKSVRTTERGAQAYRESYNMAPSMCGIMAQVLKLDTISIEQTPALARLLIKSFVTGAISVLEAKWAHGRTRPFVMTNEAFQTLYETPEDVNWYESYPSGHTASGWATALAFAEMWPALQDTILRRGFEFGENRYIMGAHWQSDVTAGYLCAAAGIARAHCNPEFEKDLRAARAEYALLKGLPEDYDPVTGADVPHGERFLNNPIDTTSYRYITDLTLYWQAKSLRDTPRGEQAAEEAEYSVAMMQKVFGRAMELTLSDEQTPAISTLIATVLDKASETADRLKPIRFRKRPFVQLNEPSFVAGDEEKERGKSSFPSGHTNLGWSEALVLAEVAPEYQDEILRRGFQYGYNRLIVGYHWFTDIEASRQLAAALVARLHADPQFRDMIAAARAEYIGKTGGTTPVASVTAESQSSGRSYRLDGTPAPAQTRGIVIQSNRKTIRK